VVSRVNLGVMGSDLYNAAVEALADEAAWLVAKAAIESAHHQDADLDGRQVLANIEGEQLLSADPQAIDPELMGRFLSELGAETWPPDHKGRQDTYAGVCTRYLCLGPPLASVPDEWLHYKVGPGLLYVIADQMAAGPAPTDLSDLAERLSERLEAGQWSSALQLLRDFWPHIPWSLIYMGRCKGRVYLTWDAGQPALRGDGAAMWHDLALPRPENGNLLLALRFASQAGDDPRLPTCADAYWFAPFRGAPAGAAHGVSCPRCAACGPQPEAVMRTPTMARLSGPEHVRALPCTV